MNERPGKQAMSQTDTSAVMNTVVCTHPGID